MNYFELDGASNNSVEDVRELVDQVRYAPQTGRYKVYVIDEVHMLSSAAFNAFLKTLEEPPSYVIFILATTEKHKILPTILSRCQIFDFKRITTQDTVEHLEDICKKEDIKADKASLHLIAQKSEGCLRDALSILDKIVSFTNGELNYANTSEHLNILDEDYYFRLMECMMAQDLSAALLLYDDINRKGFEGDLVLNGMSEFIRNLLVCKDEKAAALLDVVESFREKYISTAANIPAALLISALNILNEAEINYKAARNKRLHAELAFIRLCYLKQAIEISTEGGQLIKKKVTEAPLALRTSAIRSFTPSIVPQKKSEAKLIIQTPDVEETSNLPQDAAHKPGLSALDKIRKQYQQNGNNGNGNNIHPLQDETLQQAWAEYILKLKEEKSPAVPPFQHALLRIRDANSFDAVTGNNIEKQFIEQNRNRLFAFLKDKLQNRLLQFSVMVEERAEDAIPMEIPLTVKEQFQKMAEQYPMVKELKDRLRLELDY